MSNKITIIAAFLTICALNLNAQITFEKIIKIDALSWRNHGLCVQQTNDGGYVIAGGSTDTNLATKALLIKTDASGDTAWIKKFGFGDTISANLNSVLQTTDGGYIIAGNLSNLNDWSVSTLLIKTDDNGNIVWNKIYRDNSWLWDELGSIHPTYDGGYILTGDRLDILSQQYLYLAKFDSNGDTLWTKTFLKEAVGFSVQQTSDSGYIIAGAVRGSFNNYDVLLVKTDKNGDTLWTKIFMKVGNLGETGDDYGYSVEQTNDGGYIIGGTTFFDQKGKPYLIKTNSNGDTLWTRIFGTLWDDGRSVQQTSDGGYIFTGKISIDSNHTNLLLIKTDANGDTVWTRNFGDTSSFEFGFWVQQTLDGGYIVTGHRENSPFRHDVHLVKTDANGNIYPVGFDFLTRNNENEIFIYPNPFSQATTIKTRKNGELKLYNLLGCEILSKKIQNGETKLEKGNLPSGIYFYKINNEKREIIGSGKLLIQ